MSNQPYNLQDLWNATNNGLDYFHEVYPESIGKENKSKHFKSHTENTASTTLSNKKYKDNVYRIYNHSSREGLNAIDHCMKEQGFETFIEAAAYLFSKYGLSKTAIPLFLPTKTWNNDTDKKPGHWKVNVSKKHHNYKEVAPFLTDAICKEYDFVSLTGFETIKQVGDEKKRLC